MVHVIKRQYTHQCRRLNHRDGVEDRLSTSTGTSFITGDELDSTVEWWVSGCHAATVHSLKALIIENYSVDDFIICEDFNASCTKMWRARRYTCRESDIQNTPERDTVDHQLGKELIARLEALDLCIVNGHFDKSNDGFTSMSNKGRLYYYLPNKILQGSKKF